MSFGAGTDYWSFADSVMHLQSTGNDASPGGEAQAINEVGDVVASALYDTANATRTATYKPCSDDTLSFTDTTPGTVIDGFVVTSIEVSTSNTERPTITISGEYAHGIVDSAFAKYSATDLEIVGTRQATPVGVTPDSLTKTTGSSVSISVSVSKTMDSNGNTACMDVYGGRVEASNELVGATGAAGASVDTGWSDNGSSGSTENTAYSTRSYNVFKNILKDT